MSKLECFDCPFRLECLVLGRGPNTGSTTFENCHQLHTLFWALFSKEDNAIRMYVGDKEKQALDRDYLNK